VAVGVGSNGSAKVSEDGDEDGPATEADRDDGGEQLVEGGECVQHGFSFRVRERFCWG